MTYFEREKRERECDFAFCTSLLMLAVGVKSVDFASLPIAPTSFFFHSVVLRLLKRTNMGDLYS